MRRRGCIDDGAGWGLELVMMMRVAVAASPLVEVITHALFLLYMQGAGMNDTNYLIIYLQRGCVDGHP